MSFGEAWLSRGVAVAQVLVLASWLAGCAAITEDGTARSPVDAIDGRQVTVGYFEPKGEGYFATLKKVGNDWQVRAISRRKPQEMPRGEELLFIGTANPRAVEVTPVYGETTAVSQAKSMLVCLPGRGEYSACSSSFTKSVPLLSDRRKLDREEISRAIRQTNLFAKLEAATPAIQREELVQLREAMDTEERARARQRELIALGQAMIDRGEIGASLCADVNARNQAFVVRSFLERIEGERIQLRVNVIRSPDGRVTAGGLRLEGIDVSPGSIVWLNRREWRACE